jgi:hypothetical protein
MPGEEQKIKESMLAHSISEVTMPDKQKQRDWRMASETAFVILGWMAVAVVVINLRLWPLLLVGAVIYRGVNGWVYAHTDSNGRPK